MAGRPRKHDDHDGSPAGRQRASRAARRAQGLVPVQLMLSVQDLAALDAAAASAGLTRSELLARWIAERG